MHSTTLKSTVPRDENPSSSLSLKAVTEEAQDKEKTTLSEPTSCLSVHSDASAMSEKTGGISMPAPYASEISMNKSRKANMFLSPTRNVSSMKVNLL